MPTLKCSARFLLSFFGFAIPSLRVACCVTKHNLSPSPSLSKHVPNTIRPRDYYLNLFLFIFILNMYFNYTICTSNLLGFCITKTHTMRNNFLSVYPSIGSHNLGLSPTLGYSIRDNKSIFIS
ncbi:hypothetical protein F5Y11DRAFT_319052 [Daldinia sp. FL1419]|nr:hypothetical protein F5Y11DRAFT_319052 [Daldinia sp. FL1419]